MGNYLNEYKKYTKIILEIYFGFGQSKSLKILITFISFN